MIKYTNDEIRAIINKDANAKWLDDPNHGGIGYLGANKKTRIRYAICGHIWPTRIDKFINGQRCGHKECRYERAASKLRLPEVDVVNVKHFAENLVTTGFAVELKKVA